MRVLKIFILVLALVNFSGCATIVNEVNKYSKYTWDFDNTKTNQLYEEGKVDEALKVVNNYLKKHPKDFIALSEKAYLLVEKDENEEALIILDKLIAVDPKNDALLNNKSWAYNNLGLYKLALDYADMAIDLPPNEETEHVSKGNALYRLEKYDQSIKSYNKALSINKQTSVAYYGIARSFEGKEDNLKAYTNYKKAFDMDPADDEYLSSLIAICRTLKKYNEMISFADQRITLNPEDPDAYTYKGEAFGLLKQYINALKAYDEALKYSEYKEDVYYEKCKIYLKLNKKEEAYANLKNALKVDPEYWDYIDIEEVKALKGYKDFNKFAADYL